jgi:hypothetical protein
VTELIELSTRTTNRTPIQTPCLTPYPTTGRESSEEIDLDDPTIYARNQETSFLNDDFFGDPISVAGGQHQENFEEYLGADPVVYSGRELREEIDLDDPIIYACKQETSFLNDDFFGDPISVSGGQLSSSLQDQPNDNFTTDMGN